MANSEELQNLVDSAILGELSHIFDLQFTDSVFEHEDYYTSIPEILSDQGYNLHHPPQDGVYLSRGDSSYHINFGTFNATFVNDMAEQALGIKHLTGFPVGFDNGRKNGGKLGNFSVAAAEHFRKLNVTPAQADVSVVRMFQSDVVVQNENPESILLVVDKEVDELAQFQTFDDDGMLHIHLPTEPGYWRIDIGQPTERGDKPSTLSQWGKMLKSHFFSYRYVPNIGHLYFANTEGAKYGLPPTAKHMRWAPLDIKPREDRGPAPAREPDPRSWRPLVRTFQENPSKVTLDPILKSADARRAFLFFNSRGYVKAGSRDMGKRLKEKMHGWARAISFPEFGRFLESVSFPSGPEYYLCNLVKIGNGLSYDAEGNVYVH
jgi:hypothetical protein